MDNNNFTSILKKKMAMISLKSLSLEKAAGFMSKKPLLRISTKLVNS